MVRLPGAFKTIQGLGTPVAVYPLRNGFFSRLGSVLVVALALLGSMSLAGWAVMDGFERYYRHGQAVVLRGVYLPVLGAVLLLILAVDVLVVAIGRWRKAVVIYEQGLAVCNRDGLAFFRWGEVASLRVSSTQRTFIGIPVGATRQVALAAADGRRIAFDGDIRGVDDALQKIRLRLLPILYERFEPGFQSGQTFAFGPIELHKDQGMILKKKILPWNTLQKAAVDQGALHLAVGEENGKLKEIRVPVDDIPNLDLLMVFIRLSKPALNV
jgi:hypothetical protein